MFDLSPEDRAFLQRARLGRLATASAGGEPHVIPVCYAFDGSAIYSAVDAKPKRVAAARLRRLKNLRENPRACLVVDHYEEDWARLRYVLLFGRAEILETGPDRARAFTLLREKYPQYRAMRGFGEGPVIRLRPERVVSWHSGASAPGALHEGRGVRRRANGGGAADGRGKTRGRRGRRRLGRHPP